MYIIITCKTFTSPSPTTLRMRRGTNKLHLRLYELETDANLLHRERLHKKAFVRYEPTSKRSLRHLIVFKKATHELFSPVWGVSCAKVGETMLLPVLLLALSATGELY